MRIILADQHEQALRALKKLLQEHDEFECVGQAVDARGLLRLAESQTPDLILLDRELPGVSIQELIGRLHAIQPRPTVVVMSSNCEYSRVLLQAGADSFISKADEPDWLVEKLHKYVSQSSVKEEAKRKLQL